MILFGLVAFYFGFIYDKILIISGVLFWSVFFINKSFFIKFHFFLPLYTFEHSVLFHFFQKKYHFSFFFC